MRWIAGLLLLFSFFAQIPPQPAETIYYNGKIVTMWDAQPVAEAVAIRDNRFLAAGSTAEVMKTAGTRTKKIDLGGRSVLPGLIDSHTHPIGAALSERDEPLPVMNSIAELQAYIRQRAARLAICHLSHQWAGRARAGAGRNRAHPLRHRLGR